MEGGSARTSERQPLQMPVLVPLADNVLQRLCRVIIERHESHGADGANGLDRRRAWIDGDGAVVWSLCRGQDDLGAEYEQEVLSNQRPDEVCKGRRGTDLDSGQGAEAIDYETNPQVLQSSTLAIANMIQANSRSPNDFTMSFIISLLCEWTSPSVSLN
ncbi:MAG: hypothetical protein BVN29_19070 [Nitrospira sp. ST-bin5]|nr:MAG: hypothetical protein BVN29_19070 [Nitrospira sp. ST-bin5]